jgi:hypothetical protein
MLIEFGIPPRLLAATRDLLPLAMEVQHADSMPRVSALAGRSSGVLIGFEDDPTPELLSDLRVLRVRHPWLPIVGAGSLPIFGISSFRRHELLQAGVDRVMSYTAPTRADRALRESWRHSPLQRLAAIVYFAEHIPENIRALMVKAIAAQVPVANALELAAMGGMHRASLWKSWARSSRPLPTAGAFIDWLQLLHVAVRKDSGRTWRGVASELGVRPSSVARMGKRVLGHTLSEYDERARRRIFDRFLREAVGFTQKEIQTHALIAPPLVDAAGVPVAPLPDPPPRDPRLEAAIRAEQREYYGIGRMWAM